MKTYKLIYLPELYGFFLKHEACGGCYDVNNHKIYNDQFINDLVNHVFTKHIDHFFRFGYDNSFNVLFSEFIFFDKFGNHYAAKTDIKGSIELIQ